MSLKGRTPQNTAPVSPKRSATRHLLRWVALVVGLIGLVVGGWWVWPRLIQANEVANPSATTQIATTVVNTTNTSTTGATQQTEPVAQSVTSKAPAQQPTRIPAVTTVVTPTVAAPVTASLVVIAGTDGATLLAAPGGDPVGAVEIGALLSATGRTEDRGWLYVNTADGVAGWVMVNQIVAFGTEKLPVVVVTAPLPAAAEGNEAANAPATTTVTATTAGNTPTEVTATTVVTAPTGAPATVAASDTAPVTTTSPPAADATGVTATVIVNGARLNIRSGPGTRYGIVGKASRNETVTVLARNEAADWVQIALPDTADGFGWVAATYLRLSGAITELPVSDAVSAAPVPTTTATTATALTATTTQITAATPTSQPITNAATTGSARPASGLNGTLVFQSSPGGMIYGYNLSSGRLWQLTNGFDPAISPDGQTVAFVRAGGETGLYLIAIDGSNERLIFSGRNTLAAPKWSPDGNYIVFSRGDEYKECRDLGRGQCLTDQELLDQNPNFPVDDFPLIKQYESNLARVDLHGDNYRDLANLESAHAPDWNEAGIVYQSRAGLQITTDTPDTTSQLVTHDPYKPAYEDPDWQPNGGKIVFVSRSGNHREIYAVNPDGSSLVALTAPVTTLVAELPNNVAPAWSPDGQRIVFLSNRGADNSAGAWRLWVMNADGSNEQPLPIDVAINYTYGNEQLVSWGR